MKIKIINRGKSPLPQYATEGSAGMDLHAYILIPKVLQPRQRVLIPTGIYLELPIGYEAQIRPKSGLALNKGITVLNTPGTIDSDYRGEIGVIIYNASNEEVLIMPEQKIAQMVIAKYERVEWEETISLTDTVRNDGGFGSTGV
jgi:dUTP pyrophosphatase